MNNKDRQLIQRIIDSSIIPEPRNRADIKAVSSYANDCSWIHPMLRDALRTLLFPEGYEGEHEDAVIRLEKAHKATAAGWV